MNHQLHSTALIEKPFRDNRSLRGNRAQNRASRQDIFHNLFGAALIQAAFLCRANQHAGPRRCQRDCNIEPRAYLLPQLGDVL